MATATMQVNAAGVFALFEQAISNALKYPKIRLLTSTRRDVVLKRAGDKSKYTGQIQITDGRPFGENTYYGRIDTNGVFYPAYQDTSVVELLARLSSDPAGVASEYGRLTGNCCFCSRKLDDPKSTAVGYGPICAGKFNLPWGE